MEHQDYIVKARPGVLGGKHEEKRPLRQLSALPVKRHVFINRDSHPDANIYVAIHEAQGFAVAGAGLSGAALPQHRRVLLFHRQPSRPHRFGRPDHLRRQSSQIVSPACVYIPTGAVHEYKVTKGAGTVTVLFRDRGYTHEDKPFDLAKGERDFAKYAGYIFHPRPARRPKSNITPTRRRACATSSSTANSSRRRAFTPSCAAFRTCSRRRPITSTCTAHNCDTQHIAIGTGPELTGLKIEFQIRDEKIVVESPVGVNIPAGTRHSQRIIEGVGSLFQFRAEEQLQRRISVRYSDKETTHLMNHMKLTHLVSLIALAWLIPSAPSTAFGQSIRKVVSPTPLLYCYRFQLCAVRRRGGLRDAVRAAAFCLRLDV